MEGGSVDTTALGEALAVGEYLFCFWVNVSGCMCMPFGLNKRITPVVHQSSLYAGEEGVLVGSLSIVWFSFTAEGEAINGRIRGAIRGP